MTPESDPRDDTAHEQQLDTVAQKPIVEENNLTHNISTLRRVFGEDPV